MSRPLNRTTEAKDGVYKITQTFDPSFYKDENGKLMPIKTSWKPGKEKGEFRLIDNSFGLILNTVPKKETPFLKLLSDGGKGLSIDYKINKVSFDGLEAPVSFDVEDLDGNEIRTKSMNIRCFNNRMYQFFKCPKKKVYIRK